MAEAGMVLARSVTRQLEVADPHSQSRKAKKAREYGTRILAEPVFWRALGVEID